MNKFIPPDAELVPDDAKRVFKGEIYDVYQWPQQMYDGTMATFEMVKRTDSVVIIAVVDNELVLLTESQPHKSEYQTLPCGRVEPDEHPDIAAKRELLEETGMEFVNWKLVGVAQVAPKTEQFVYTYVATDLVSQSEQNLDNGEKISVGRISFEQYLELIRQDKIRWDNFILRQYILGNTTLSDILNLPEITR